MRNRLKDGRIYMAVGASRSGKSAWVRHQIRDKKRLMIWDPKPEYEAHYRASTPAQLARIVLNVKHCAGVIAYSGKLGDFDQFCRLAFQWVLLGYKAGVYSCVVIEETSDVTSPSKAPPSYGELLRKGLCYGCDIVAICQRPAESDKTSIGNAGVIHCCRVARAKDRAYMADELGVPIEQIAALRADRKAGIFDYIESDLESGEIIRGVMKASPAVRGDPIFQPIKGKKPL